LHQQTEESALPKPSSEFHDPMLGLLVSEHRGVWLGRVPFADQQVQVLILGTKREPNAAQLAHAGTILPKLSALVQNALDFLRSQEGGDFVFEGLNYCLGCSHSDFALDFTEVGDTSGNSWTVAFRSGEPVEMQYH
jgi:hypothetical protein